MTMLLFPFLNLYLKIAYLLFIDGRIIYPFVKLIKVKNLYFQKNTSQKIMNILKKLNFKKTIVKKFVDLKKI